MEDCKHVELKVELLQYNTGKKDCGDFYVVRCTRCGDFKPALPDITQALEGISMSLTKGPAPRM